MAEQVQIGAFVEEDHVVVRLGQYGAAMTVENAVKLRDSIQRAITGLSPKGPLKMEVAPNEQGL